MYDVVVIGKGPAGVSGAIYAFRGRLKTIIIGKNSNLEKAHVIDNYYGFPGGISGSSLFEKGEEQAKKLGIELVDDTVISIEYLNETFKVLTQAGEYCAPTVLLATGRNINKVNIENIEKYEGKGIHYCVACDGFFYKNLKVGVLGYTDYAVHEVKELMNFSSNITLYTNGNSLQISDSSSKMLEQSQIKINDKKIIEFIGNDNLSEIIFEDGSRESTDGVFVAYGSATSADFARKLGVFTNKDEIVVDKEYRTNIPGLYAAGDCTGGFKQISIAVGQGAIAGQNIVEYIRSLRK